MTKDIQKVIDIGANEYGLTELVKIDVAKAKETAKFIFTNDKEGIFRDFIFKSIEFLQELETQKQLVDMVTDATIDENSRLKGVSGYQPLTQDELKNIESNRELLTGNLKLAQTMLNNFLGAHYEPLYKRLKAEK